MRQGLCARKVCALCIGRTLQYMCRGAKRWRGTRGIQSAVILLSFYESLICFRLPPWTGLISEGDPDHWTFQIYTTCLTGTTCRAFGFVPERRVVRGDDGDGDGCRSP